MAKLSRRAVASPPSSSTSSASSNSAASISSPNANNIGYAGKPARVSSTENAPPKYAENGGQATGNAYADPLRDSNALHQFTTHSSRISATTSGAYERSPYSAHPALIDNDGAASPSPPYLSNRTIQAQILAAERERIRAEFFATYDVMTGVRIAATLGGFFGLMVFLIVWKSRSSSNETMKVLKDPKMAAVAAVCMQEEEEREIQEAMVATGMSIYPDEYEAIAYQRQRMLSLGNVSAPPMLTRGRFASVGGAGYSSLRRFSYSAVSGAGSLGGGRRRSGSESSRVLSNYPMGSSFGNDDYFMETEDELENGDYGRSGQHLEDLEDANHKRTDSTKSKQGFLEVPLMGQDSRRSSAMTCCSTESSYLERRTSAFTLGMSNLPPSLQRKLSTASRTSSTDNWDYYYPDIQVIQPTPKQSPCPSERSIYEQLKATAAPAPVVQLATSVDNTATATTKTGRTYMAANGGTAPPTLPTFVRKHSIAYYDPQSAQAGRKQQIHSISADTVDVYPYNQAFPESSRLLGGLPKPVQSAPPVGIHQGFHFTDAPLEELRLNVRRKIAVVELQRLPHSEQMTPPPHSATVLESNNNSFPYTQSAAAKPAAVVTTAATANSSSISVDSMPVSIDKLNGSDSLGTISAKALFNVEKRAPLASLSSFRISSLEYQDSEMRSLDDDSVFVDSIADTDEDMQQLSSDSEEASLGEHGAAFVQADTNLIESSGQEALSCANVQLPLKNPIEKRFNPSASNTSGKTASRSRKPFLQRHHTISASSSDRVSLIGQQLKEFPSREQGSSSQMTTTAAAVQIVPLETHFGTVISTSSSPTHPRRAQLMQQHSDTQSLPTTTEDETCSTLNTDLGAGTEAAGGTSGGCSGGAAGGGSTTHTQHSSLNTVISLSHASPLMDNNDTSCSGPAAAEISSETKPQTQSKQQLPPSRLADDPCASSVSDSIINTHQSVICMPPTLKNLILRGSTSADKPAADAAVSKSAMNLNLLDSDAIGDHGPRPAVMLELPLIKLPTSDESSESSSASVDVERSRSKSDESRDPSLPGSSRKWSKETLF